MSYTVSRPVAICLFLFLSNCHSHGAGVGSREATVGPASGQAPSQLEKALLPVEPEEIRVDPADILIEQPFIGTEQPGDPGDAARDEEVAARTPFTKSFVNEDGSRTVQLGSVPIHYRPPDTPDELLPIDTTLTEEEDGWGNRTNSFPVRLPRALGIGQPIALGPEEAIRWVPGALYAVLTSGEIVELAEPRPSEGIPAEGPDDAILFPQVYPGIDLQLALTAGSLALHAIVRDFPYEIEPEQILALEIRGPLEVEEHLLGALRGRQELGQPAATLPLYFAGPEDEFVIAPLTERPVDAAVIEAYVTAAATELGTGEPLAEMAGEAPAGGISSDVTEVLFGLDDLRPDGEEAVRQDSGEAEAWRYTGGDPAGFEMDSAEEHEAAASAAYRKMVDDGHRGAYAELRDEGSFTARFAVRLAELPDDRIESGEQYVTVAFQYVHRRVFQNQRYLQIAPNAYSIMFYPSIGFPTRDSYNKSNGTNVNAMRVDTERALVPIRGIQQLKPFVDPRQGWQIREVFIGYQEPAYERLRELPMDTDHIIAHGLQGWRSDFEAGMTSEPPRKKIWTEWDNTPFYNYDLRPLPSGARAFVSTWATAPRVRLIDGKLYTFGKMTTGTYVGGGSGTGRVVPAAPGDLKRVVDQGATYWLLGLRNPYDARKCLECVREHRDRAALERLGGKDGLYSTGARLRDVRLEVVAERTVARSADFTVETAVDPKKPWEIYPGETLELDLTLQNPSGFSEMQLFEDTGGLPPGISVAFYQPPGAAQPVPRAILRRAGDQARIKVTWAGRMPGVSSFKLPLVGSFDGRLDDPFASNPLAIAVKLPPLLLEMTPASTALRRMQDQAAWQLLGKVRMPATARGLSAVKLTLIPPPNRWKSPWLEGREFMVHPRMISGNVWSELWVDTSRVAEKLGASAPSKPHQLFLEACALYDRIYGLQCSGAGRARISIPLALETPRPAGWVRAEFLEPWSVETVSTRTPVTVHGTSLVDPASGPKIAVTDPAGKRVAGQKVTRAASQAVGFDFASAPGTCGPYTVSLTRSAGVVDDRILSATRALPAATGFVVVEAENAESRSSQGIVKLPTASGGRAILARSANDSHRLQFRPPVTGTYAMFLRARPTSGTRSLRIGLRPVNPQGPTLGSFTTTLRSASNAWVVQAVFEGAKPWSARLTAGTTYELEVASGRSSPPYSATVDMVVLTTDRSRAPTAAELCLPGS